MDLFDTDTWAAIGAPEVRLPRSGVLERCIFLGNNLQRIRLLYLRLVSGASGDVPDAVVLCEFEVGPLVCQWPQLVLRLRNQLAQQSYWLLHSVVQVNVAKAVLCQLLASLDLA